MKLLISALIKFLCGLLLVSALVFLPAGTFKYFDGWIFIAVLFIPIFIMGIVLFVNSPQLLKKRLDGKEKEKTQKGVVLSSAIVFLLSFIIAGLDFRFGLSTVPFIVQFIAIVVFLLSYGLYAEVIRENAYLSRAIKVQENQTVIDSGLYGIIRHPMYAATVLMFLSMPLILGSWISFAILLFYPIIISVRIKNEEKILCEQLDGYTEYIKRVKYKIIPFIW